MKIEFNLQGGKELDLALKNLSARLSRKVILNALRAGGREIIKDARRRAPKKTGTLRKSISQKAAPRSHQPGSTVLQIYTKKGKNQKYDAWYSHLVEFGWTDRAGGHHAGRPFLRPAVDALKAKVIAIIGRRIGDNIIKGAERFK